MDYQNICFLVLKSGKPVSNAYVARADGKKGLAFSNAVKSSLANGNIEENKIFVTTDAYIADFKNVLENGKACAKKHDNFIFIFVKSKENELQKYFDPIGR